MANAPFPSVLTINGFYFKNSVKLSLCWEWCLCKEKCKRSLNPSGIFCTACLETCNSVCMHWKRDTALCSRVSASTYSSSSWASKFWVELLCSVSSSQQIPDGWSRASVSLAVGSFSQCALTQVLMSLLSLCFLLLCELKVFRWFVLKRTSRKRATHSLLVFFNGPQDKWRKNAVCRFPEIHESHKKM